MSGAQRKAHVVIWLVLGPLLLIGVFAAIFAMQESPLGHRDAPEQPLSGGSAP